jgi:hypothetical protein
MKLKLFLFVLSLLVLGIFAAGTIRQVKLKPIKTTNIAKSGLSTGVIIGILIASVCVPLLLIVCFTGVILYCLGFTPLSLAQIIRKRFVKREIVAETPYYGNTTIIESQPSNIYY